MVTLIFDMLTSIAVASESWMQPLHSWQMQLAGAAGREVAMRLATLTVSPRTENFGVFVPCTPAKGNYCLLDIRRQSTHVNDSTSNNVMGYRERQGTISLQTISMRWTRVIIMQTPSLKIWKSRKSELKKGTVAGLQCSSPP